MSAIKIGINKPPIEVALKKIIKKNDINTLDLG